MLPLVCSRRPPGAHAARRKSWLVTAPESSVLPFNKSCCFCKTDIEKFCIVIASQKAFLMEEVLIEDVDVAICMYFMQRQK